MSERVEESLVLKTQALLRLSEDETPLVREAVTRELCALPLDLPSFTHDRQITLSESQIQFLDSILWERNRDQLTREWSKWLEYEEGAGKLEQAMDIFSRFQNGSRYRPSISCLLDEMADAFSGSGVTVTHRELVRFLYDTLGFTDCPEGQKSSNSLNLACVLESRQGLPITLVCIFVLLGYRLGLHASACLWPGSYYARFREEDVLYLVDFTNKGFIVTAEELLSLQGPSRSAAKAVVTAEMVASTLVRRVVSELAMYFRREGNTKNSILMLDLLRMFDWHARNRAMESAAP